MTTDMRRYAAAAARNRESILAVLAPYLPWRGLVLEIASGSGEHIVSFAQSSGSDVAFQPSDPDPGARASIDAWVNAVGLTTVRPAIVLDATVLPWPVSRADVIVCINMIHVAPWEAAQGLVKGAARVLAPDGFLYVYGPFRRDGRHTSEGNEQFDRDLRLQDPRWGIRDLAELSDLAVASGLTPPLVVDMPANNLSLFFRRQGDASQ